MKTVLTGTLIALLAIGYSKTATANETTDEVTKIREIFQKDVGTDTAPDEVYRQKVIQHVTDSMKAVPDSALPQYFLFVDANFERQLIMVGYWDGAGKVTEIGWDKVSTGSLKSGHFLTPTGTFPIVRLGYRAEGTKNAKGWMGLGIKDSRVWSFGEQETTGWKGRWMRITMLMHSTDPYWGEPRLGTPDSKGCIRISARMNAFLDIYGILDRHIIENESPARQKRLLREDRKPVKDLGLYMIIANFPPEPVE